MSKKERAVLSFDSDSKLEYIVELFHLVVLYHSGTPVLSLGNQNMSKMDSSFGIFFMAMDDMGIYQKVRAKLEALMLSDGMELLVFKKIKSFDGGQKSVEGDYIRIRWRALPDYSSPFSIWHKFVKWFYS